MNHFRRILLIIPLILLFLTGCAPKQATDISVIAEDLAVPNGLIKQLVTGDDAASTQAADELVKYPVERLIQSIENFNDYPSPSVVGEPFEQVHHISDSLNAPYYTLIPESYKPSEMTPLMIWLHGGVSRPEFSETDPAELMEHPIFQVCNEQGWIVVFPLAKNGCLWWDDTGIGHIGWIVRQMKRQFNIDDNKVVLGGFSDGASGSFHIAMLNPTDFGLFFPWSGNIAVGSLVGQEPVYLPNMRGRKLFATNGGADRLYPAKRMEPLMSMVKEADVDLTFTAYDTAGHNYGYLVDEWGPFVDRVKSFQRNSSPDKQYWELTNITYNRVDWLEISGLDTTGQRQQFHKEYNYMMTSDNITIGFGIDQEWDQFDKGVGVRVRSVTDSDDYPAKQMGLMAGDVIIKMDEFEVKGVDDIVLAKSKKQRGDAMTLQVIRNEVEILLEGSLPPISQYDALLRTTPSGAVEVTRTGNSYDAKASRVTGFSMYIDPKTVNLDEPVTVTVNGVQRFSNVVKPDSRLLLEQFLRDRDRTRLYAARIDVEL